MIKVLLIDDEADFCELLKANLEEAGEFEVLTTANSQEGLKLARIEHPDVILLDILMPGMDGGMVAEVLKRDSSTSNIPIIFLTAIVTANEIGRSGKEIKGRYFYAKPVDTNSLIALIKKVLSGEEDS